MGESECPSRTLCNRYAWVSPSVATTGRIIPINECEESHAAATITVQITHTLFLTDIAAYEHQ
jgi:hypothetical protein